MKKLILPLVALAAIPAVGAAQSANPVSASIRAQYGPVKTNIVAAAQQMPEEHYGFQPTPEVRTFGQLIGHVAFAQFNICAGLLGEANPRPGNLEEQLTTKPDLVEAITQAFEFCDAAYAGATDATLGDAVSFFGSPSVRHYPLTYALVHADHHYGNIVTYMRLKGLVPPSSQGG